MTSAQPQRVAFDNIVRSTSTNEALGSLPGRREMVLQNERCMYLTTGSAVESEG